MYVAAEHIEQWLRAGKAKLITDAVASQLGAYLNQLPWLPAGGGLDWSQMKGSPITLSAFTEQQQHDWLRTTLMGNDPLLIFWYVPDQPCIACDVDFAISNIDQAFWKAPGKRYLFGARIHNGIIEPVMSHFAEYDGADTLTAAQ
jgi:hypothetical protein